MPIDIQQLPGTGFNGDHRVYSNFFADNQIIQNVSVVQPKNLLIDTLRKHFSRDNVYTFRADEYGFPLTPDLTDLNIDSPETTKILITDVFRHEIKFYPSITVKSGGGSYNPLSINQNSTIKYRKDLVRSEFGAVREVKTATHRVYAGAWDMTFDISIYSESHSELEEIAEIVKMILQYVSYNELRANGLFIKTLNIGAENAETYSNDYVFSQSITIATRSEWRVEVPLENVVEKIAFYFDVIKTPSIGLNGQANIQALKFDDYIEMAEIKL